jgi:hypothetical protein
VQVAGKMRPQTPLILILLLFLSAILANTARREEAEEPEFKIEYTIYTTKMHERLYEVGFEAFSKEQLHDHARLTESNLQVLYALFNGSIGDFDYQFLEEDRELVIQYDFDIYGLIVNPGLFTYCANFSFLWWWESETRVRYNLLQFKQQGNTLIDKDFMKITVVEGYISSVSEHEIHFTYIPTWLYVPAVLIACAPVVAVVIRRKRGSGFAETKIGS